MGSARRLLAQPVGPQGPPKPRGPMNVTPYPSWLPARCWTNHGIKVTDQFRTHVPKGVRRSISVAPTPGPGPGPGVGISPVTRRRTAGASQHPEVTNYRTVLISTGSLPFRVATGSPRGRRWLRCLTGRAQGYSSVILERCEPLCQKENFLCTARDVRRKRSVFTRHRRIARWNRSSVSFHPAR